MIGWIPYVLLNYLGTLGNMLTSSGVIVPLSESGAFSNITIKHILAAGNYKRGVRFYKLLYGALLWKKLEAPKQWMMATDREHHPRKLGSIWQAHQWGTYTGSWGSGCTDATVGLCFSRGFLSSEVLERIPQNCSNIAEFDTSKEVWKLVTIYRKPNLYAPYVYAYNRLNYCQLLPIYICDMVDFEENAPEVH